MRPPPHPTPTALLAALVLLASPSGAEAWQADAATRQADPEATLEPLHELQAEFERYRERNTPVQRETAHGCDERIGRICIWFGEEAEQEFPGELRQVRQARVELIRALSRGFEEAPHGWILGQWVHYLVENGDVREAARVAQACGIDEVWWCAALHGYVLHKRGSYVEAEQAFRRAVGSMPDDVRIEWTVPSYIVSGDTREVLEDASAEEREALVARFWRLSDPLFLFLGNDRLTDHFARRVEATNRRDAVDPLGMEWGEDLEETLIRYGMNTGYGRTHDPSRMMRNGFGDTRRMIGFHHPKSRGYLFPEDFLESPSDIPAESWITAPREARTWYAPPYAPEMRGLETQVGRFRRGDRMLVVGAYRPTVPSDEAPGGFAPAWGPSGVSDPISAGLFLVDEDGAREPEGVRGRAPEGVLTIESRPGRYVSGLEVFDAVGRRAWRARQGVVQEPLIHGMVDVSDLMILKENSPLPDSLADALPHLRPGIRVHPGERLPVLWEVYGLGVLEPVRVTLGFSEGRPGFMTRVGDFLGVIEPDRNVDITFDDTGPEEEQAVFRSIEIELPDVDPGEYTLHLRLELAGREPLTISRPILVDPR